MEPQTVANEEVSSTKIIPNYKSLLVLAPPKLCVRQAGQAKLKPIHSFIYSTLTEKLLRVSCCPGFPMTPFFPVKRSHINNNATGRTKPGCR
jgi:hypothetical protein